MTALIESTEQILREELSIEERNALEDIQEGLCQPDSILISSRLQELGLVAEVFPRPSYEITALGRRVLEG